ncbi:unnamed protein product, partial [Ascophyllum nodosum]
PPAVAPPLNKGPAPMRNLYTAALSYNGYTITDGALRLIVLLHAADLGFNAIEIAFMFSLYEVAGVFTNLFGGVAGSKFGLQCTLITSMILQIVCLSALTQTERIVGSLSEVTSGSARYMEATLYITAWQMLAGVAKDFMKLTGKATPKLVTKEGAEGRLFQLVAWLTGMKNALKGFGSAMGALLVSQIGWINSLWILVGFLFLFLPLGVFGMDRLELGWRGEVVGLVLAGYIIIYGNLQAMTTNLYKKSDGSAGQPTGVSAFMWAGSCSVVPLVTGIVAYFTHIRAKNDIATAIVLIVGTIMFAAIFAVNSSVHSYLIVSYSNKDKVAMDLGFYYMANAMGRLIGVLIGGFLYHYTYVDFGLSMCLIVACPFLVVASAVAYMLPRSARTTSVT